MLLSNRRPVVLVFDFVRSRIFPLDPYKSVVGMN